MSPSNIRYLKRTEIDISKWDRCIDKASNGLIYGYSKYLDAMADHWDAIIVNDYDAVMPLPWKKKYGIQYIYQPFLTAQLGLFGNSLNEKLLSECLSKIPSKFRLWEFPLNHDNVFHVPPYELYTRKNFVLDLSSTYEKLQAGYRENIRRNIKKSVQYGCAIQKGIALDHIIELAGMSQQGNEPSGFSRFHLLFNSLLKEGKAKTYGIVSGQGQVLASAAFLFSHKRCFYILVGNHPNGRTLGASHALIDAFIKDHAGEMLTLDFEGSDMRNLAFFYSSFGAVEETYSAIRLNRLPWYIRWLKK